MNTEISGTATSGDQAQNVYSFDDYNNRTGLTYTNYVSSSENTQTNYTYDSANRLQTQSVTSENDESKTDYSYNYDNAGNLLNKQQLQSGSPVTVESFAYDALNETSSITNGSVATSFKYDANDQRINKTSGSTTTESLWDGGSIVADFATTGSTTTYNQYLSGNMGAIVNGGTAYTNLINGQGDAIATANSSTNAISSYSFDSYGNKTSGSTTATPFSYRNQYSDSETGLYYLQSRYYNPDLERFISKDDQSYHDGMTGAAANLYAYANNNPVVNSDPNGHFLWIIDAVISAFLNVGVELISELVAFYTKHRTINGFKPNVGALIWAGAWGFALGMIPIFPNRALTGIITGLANGFAYLLYNSAHHIKINLSNWLQNVIVGYVAGIIAIELPGRLILTSASIRQLASSITMMLEGNVISKVYGA